MTRTTSAAVAALTAAVLTGCAHAPRSEIDALRREALGRPPGAGPEVDLSMVDREQFDLPVVLSPEVRAWVSYWAGDGCRAFLRRLERAKARRPAIERALAAVGLPLDLAALPLVESGLIPDAVSAAGAVGEWQLMPATARALGLRVDDVVDERLDPDRSAAAGARYLVALTRALPSAYLAWAAYNAGPSAIEVAIRDGDSVDYWTLARSGRLSPEAANYVPKIVAAAILTKYANRLASCTSR